MSEIVPSILVGTKKVFSLLGLSAKAGYLASGEFSTENAVKTGTAKLVVIASDASENTKKMFRNMCSFYHVPIYFFGDKESLGHAIGKEYRASLSVNNEGMAHSIEEILKKVIASNE